MEFLGSIVLWLYTSIQSVINMDSINPLNDELNPICHLLALL